MTFKKTLYYTSLILFLLVNSSCKKWLDLQPLDGITRQEYWKTKEDLAAAVTGCYSSLVSAPPGVKADRSDGGGRPIPLSIFLWGEVRGDMVAPLEANSTQEQRDIKDIVNLNVTSLNTLVTWAAFYRTINYCNTIVEFAPEVKKTDLTLSDAEYNRYIGEALAIRSLMYFYLVRTFRDVPLKLKATSKDSDIEEIGKTQASVILEQIVNDLKQAEVWLPEKYGTDKEINKGRFTKLGVNTLLADVYLWMDNYSGCLAECNKVLEYAAAHPLELKLINASSSWWTQVFGDGSSTETIFELSHKYQSNNIIQNPFANYLLSPGGRRFLTTAHVTSPLFEADLGDPENLRRDIREVEYFNKETSVIIKHNSSTISYDNFQVYRLSDVYLMKAEALAFSGQGSLALPILAELRLARRALVTTDPPSPADDEAIGRYILDERARELAFEGKRWFDLLRYAKRNNYAGLHILLEVVSKTVVGSAQQSAIAKLRDFDSHYLPINEADIIADTKLVQNPFYTR